MSERIDASELPALLEPGMRVYVGGGACEPQTLVRALRLESEAAAGVTFIQSIVPGLSRTDFAAFHPEARIVTFFMTPETQESFALGKVDFVPMQLRAIGDYLAETRIDAALIQVAATDDPAWYSPGVNADYIDAVIENAGFIVAEVNAQMPAPRNAPAIPSERVAWLVEADYPPAPYPLVTPGPDSIAIGRHVAGLVRDGDCIQSGIGAIPYAVLSELSDKNDLGLHSGIIDDAAWRLAERGVLTGAAKTLDRGRHVAASALGSRDFYRWVGSHPDVALKPYRYTHSATVLAEIENFVSVNSAMEVDFHGQVNSEMLRGRQITGTGGAVDFMRGAAAAKGGRSVIALTSTAARGKVSRIVPRLAAENAATALRTDVDIVVTEHGIARLRRLPLPERARALIAIAAPAFRESLEAAARELFGGLWRGGIET